MGLSKLSCHVWSALLLSPTMAPPPYFVYICLHAIPFSIYFGFNVGNLGKPRYLASSNFRNLPPLAKFSKFWGKFSICQIVRLTLANLLYYWSNFHCCKRPDTEKISNRLITLSSSYLLPNVDLWLNFRSKTKERRSSSSAGLRRRSRRVRWPSRGTSTTSRSRTPRRSASPSMEPMPSSMYRGTSEALSIANSL